MRSLARWRWVLLGGMSAVLVVVLVVGGWWYVESHPFGRPGRTVVVDVAPGESVAQLAGTLADRGVISSAFAFRVDCAVFGAPVLVPGEHVIALNSSFGRVRAVFSSSPNAVSVDVAPGLTVHEVALQLASVIGPGYGSAFLAATQAAVATSPFSPDGRLEGLIGSGRYVVRPGETASQLVAAMTARFESQARRAGIVPGRTHHGLSAYQLVIAASIDQKEGYYPVNFGPVARVILNRLAEHDALQMDSTVLYPLGRDGGKVTPSMLAIRSPYNTYLNAGLTPTPICVPSPAALRAVVHPPHGHWLYFVLYYRDGRMKFADTYAEQLTNEHVVDSRGLQ